MKAFVPAPILPLLSLLPGTAGVKQDLALLQRTVSTPCVDSTLSDGGHEGRCG